MCTLEDLSDKLDTFIGNSEKRLVELERRQKQHQEKLAKLTRKDDELERMIMNHVEATLVYVRSIDDKLSDIKNTLSALPCSQNCTREG